MLCIDTPYVKLLGELEDVVRLFLPAYRRGEGDVLYVRADPARTDLPIEIIMDGSVLASDNFLTASEGIIKIRDSGRECDWTVKKTLFTALKRVFDVDTPYGCLTGIRPTKLAFSLLRGGLPMQELEQYLQRHYFVSPQKAALIADICRVQGDILADDSSEYDFYVNIPFCPTRCRYCSFISVDYARSARLVDSYLNTLFYEIKQTLEMLKGLNRTCRAVYIGGGTPTVLNAAQLGQLVEILPAAAEFTVEAGRPETITTEKLRAIEGRATRISINPQTFNDEVLRAIGRNHTAAHVFEAFEIAKGFSFDINMDIIAGLIGDTAHSFSDTLTKTLALSPQNVTVHSLCVKRTADITVGDIDVNARSMIEEAHERLCESGYYPYYMYRQKYQTQNLENTGYAKSRPCLFNIDTMEENVSIIAAGAGAISKIFYSGQNRLERASNVKNIKDYMGRIEEMLQRKANLMSKLPTID